jgi:hypothetical protein
MRRVVVGLLAVVAALAVATPGAQAYPGAPWFEPSKPYTSNFPDPSIVRVGGTYYAYGTSTGGSYLPAMSSTDLTNWTARPAYDPGPAGNPQRDRFFNDALPLPAPWAPDVNSGHPRLKKEIWAPGVAQIGGRFVAFFSVRDRVSPERFCISVATATNPLGPFSDDSGGCLQRDTDPKGSIDPQPFVDDDGTPYLIWKSEGVPGSQPTKIWSRRLDASGTAFAAGSSPTMILATSQPWEGNVVENAAMVRHQGELYLFYSGNEWRSGNYATSYALCPSPTAACTKPRQGPLLASRNDRLGPGAPAPFVDAQGQLRLAYHYWNAPYTDYPSNPSCDGPNLCASQGQRRMAVEPVYGSGAGLRVGGPPPVQAVARSIDDACPAGTPEDGFTDVPPNNAHEAAIDCMVAQGVARGTGPSSYSPAAPVNREQMAAFLARLVERSGATLPASPPDAFRDDESSVFELQINQLAALGVVGGTSATTYDPAGRVTRGQMATFLVRLFDSRSSQKLSSSTDYFSDDIGSPHETSINKAAGAGFTGGRPDGTYAPLGHVARDAMASFLARTLDLLVERGVAPRR